MSKSKDGTRESSPPRVRLSTSIDLTKAKKGCKRCHGRGVTGHRQADLGDGKGTQEIPVICRCVTRGGGVRLDELDRICLEAQEQIESGLFHENLVADIQRMPEEQRPRVVAGMLKNVVDNRKSAESRDAIQKALDLLGSGEDWHDLRGKAIRMLMRDVADPVCDASEKELATRAMKAARETMN